MQRVFLDDYWAAEVAPGYEVPGWFFLRARRHTDALVGLDDAEAATFGTRSRDLVRAVERATGAPAVYLLHFGESFRHFHALVIARAIDTPAELRGAAILQLLPSERDRDSALRVASRVRGAYLEILGELQPGQNRPTDAKESTMKAGTANVNRSSTYPGIDDRIRAFASDGQESERGISIRSFYVCLVAQASVL